MFASFSAPRSIRQFGVFWPTLRLFAVMLLAMVSVLYLGNGLSELLAAMRQSVVLTPLVWLTASLPTIVVLGALYSLARQLGRMRPIGAIALAVLPIILQFVVVAPISNHRLSVPARDDGGTLPIFAPNDVLAIMDMPGQQSRSSGVCGPTCVQILQATSVEALFLPRTFFDTLGEASGVIYRLAPRGEPCDVTVTLARRAQACLTTTPARLSHATHILSMSELAPQTDHPDQIGLWSGRQIRLTGVGSTRPLFQETGISGRRFAPFPLIGDPLLEAQLPIVVPRFRTQPVSRPLADIRLIEWFARNTIRTPRL